MDISYENMRSIEKSIAAKIDEYITTEFSEDFRDHLGASEIGRECEREIFYKFRWFNEPNYKKVDPDTGEVEDHTARMKRLFQRGHCEEDRLVSYLRGIGATVHEVNPETGEQWRVSGLVGGHFGGSLDGIAVLPESVTGLSFPLPVLLEFKTYGTKSFKRLEKLGLDQTKPEHVTQMSVYGWFYQLQYSVYMAIQKDDDTLKVLFRKLDPNRGLAAVEKATRVVLAQNPPDRIREDPSYYKCKFCDHKRTCHETGLPTLKNCRSCQYGRPMPGPTWVCGQNNQVIPREVLLQGCDWWEPLK
jgi:hypothetical protein